MFHDTTIVLPQLNATANILIHILKYITLKVFNFTFLFWLVNHTTFLILSNKDIRVYGIAIQGLNNLAKQWKWDGTRSLKFWHECSVYSTWVDLMHKGQDGSFPMTY